MKNAHISQLAVLQRTLSISASKITYGICNVDEKLYTLRKKTEVFYGPETRGVARNKNTNL